MYKDYFLSFTFYIDVLWSRRERNDTKMLAKEMRHKAIAAHYAILEEYNSILKKVEQSALNGYFKVNWYMASSYDLLLDEEYTTNASYSNPSEVDEVYSVENLYRIIVYLLQEDGFYIDVDDEKHKLVISWGGLAYVESLIRGQ